MLGVMVPDVEPMLAGHGVPTWHRESWVEPKVDGSPHSSDVCQTRSSWWAATISSVVVGRGVSGIPDPPVRVALGGSPVP